MGSVLIVLGDADFALEVYRTHSAITRSSRPTPPPAKRSNLSRTSHSLSNPTYRPDQPSSVKLARGHLAYYRTIAPPTPCIAFRARVDYEDEEGKEKAVLGTAGAEAAYLWDLEDESKVETIKLGPEIQGRIQVSSAKYC